jgi:hypothetical protein
MFKAFREVEVEAFFGTIWLEVFRFDLKLLGSTPPKLFRCGGDLSLFPPF